MHDLTTHPLSPLLVTGQRGAELRSLSRDIPSLDLSLTQICDLELLLSGGFAPLTGYLDQADYQSVLESMRLADGRLWPMPLVLDLPDNLAESLSSGDMLALRDREGFMLALLHVGELWQADRKAEARAVYGTDNPSAHPGVAAFLAEARPWLVSGRVEGVRLPQHHDASDLRLAPAESRARFERIGWHKVLGCHAERPLHQSQRDSLLQAARSIGAGIFLQPVGDEPMPLGASHFVRVRCLRELLPHFPPDSVLLGLTPLVVRQAGPREALWQAMVRRNYGCTHFAVAPDQADPFRHTGQELFYPKGAALALLQEHARESGIPPVPLEPFVFDPAEGKLKPESQAGPDAEAPLCYDELRRRLEMEEPIPDWFTFPEVLAELVRAHPPRHRQGFTVFLTGLSGSGKSTLAKILSVKFMEMQHRPVTLLDGDIVRKNLSQKLGFSREDRDINVRRIGFVASEITKNGGIAICAPIAPMESSRRANRELISQCGGYVEVYLSTPIATCEERDAKGMYAKARAGLIKGFTGVDDPYEVPAAHDIELDTSNLSPVDTARQVLTYLEEAGYIR